MDAAAVLLSYGCTSITSDRKFRQLRITYLCMIGRSMTGSTTDINNVARAGTIAYFCSFPVNQRCRRSGLRAGFVYCHV